MSDEPSLELRSVVQRFKESSTALEELQERLRALALAEEQQSRVATALDGTAETVARFAVSADAATSTLQEAITKATDALSAASSFLAGTDLSALNSVVHEMERVLGDLAARITVQAEDIDGLHKSIERIELAITTESQNARQEASEAKRELTELQSKIGSLPDRVRRKAGL